MDGEYRVKKEHDDMSKGDRVYSDRYGYVEYYMRGSEETYIASLEDELLHVEESIWKVVESIEDRDVLHPKDAESIMGERIADYQRETEDWVYESDSYDCHVYTTSEDGYILHEKPYSEEDKYIYREDVSGLPSFDWVKEGYNDELVAGVL
jgi:hypothetical protein